MAQSSRVARLNLYKPIPSDPTDWFDADELDRARRYNRPLQIFAFVYGTVGFTCLALLIASHAAPRIIRATGVRSWPLQILVAIAAVLVPLEIITIPLEAWRTRFQRRWEMTVPGSVWKPIADELGGLLAGLLLVSVLALAVWAVIRITTHWWILTAAVVYAVALIVVVVLSLLGVPFEKLTRIDDDDLRARVRKVAREAGVDVIDVFQSDESRRSPVQGGHLAGFGRGRRLILYDNLLSRRPAEIDVFLARKISGLRRRQGIRRAAALGVLIAIQFAVIRLVLSWSFLLRVAGVRTVRDPAALPLMGLVFALTVIVLELGLAWVQRSSARFANLDALEFTRDVDAYSALIRGVHVRNLADLAPSWWRRVRSDQPPPAELLALGAWWRARRRVTVLFTDIENSTALLDTLGDEGWYQLRRDHNEIIRERVLAHDGIEVDSAGDGFLIVFEDAGEALLCAIESQRALDGYNHEHPDTNLRVRMGLHAGDVIRKGREVVGREVHVAARVASIAQGTEILASESVRDAVAGTDRFTFEGERDVELKGFSGTYAVSRVSWARITESVAP